MKTTRVKTPKTPKKRDMSRSKLMKECDMWFSRYIRMRDANKKGYITCISCPTQVHRKKAHCCHYIGRANIQYRRSEDNCYAGCVSCNTYRQEMHMRMFTLFMIKKYGIEKVQKMQMKTVTKIGIEEIRMLIENYKSLVKKNPIYK